jgi:hypothetical protein
LQDLPELPIRVIIDLARRLDMHPVDLVADLEPVLANRRQAAKDDPCGPGADDTPATMGTSMSTRW